MKDKTKQYILVIIFIAIILGLSIYNCIKCPSSFFKLNISNVLTLVVVFIFAFFIVQRKQDNRRLKDSVVKILEDMQSLDTEKFTCDNFSKDSIDILQQNMRNFNNKLNALKNLSKKINIQDDIEYIENQFNGYKTLIDNHIQEYDHLNNSAKELNQFIALIDSRITTVIIKIYSGNT